MSELLDLNWDVFVTPGIPTVTSDLPQARNSGCGRQCRRLSSPRKRDAVLGRRLYHRRAGRRARGLGRASGKNLTTIYATHGHGDHFFGAGTVLERFPRARFIATPDVVKIMAQQASPQFLASFWNARFPVRFPIIL